MKTVTAWSSPDYRKVWGAGAVAGLGAEIGDLALPVLALVTLGASAQEMSWVRAAMYLPYLLLTLWLGVVVDRYRRRRMMIGAELVSALLLVSMAALALTGLLGIPMLVVFTFLIGSLAVLHSLADFSFLPHVVTAEQLPDANARVTATESAIDIGGSGLGGALVQAVTAPVALLINGIASVTSALLLWRVRTDEPAPDRQEANAVTQAGQGLAALWRNRSVRGLAVEATTWNLGNEVFMLAVTVAILTSRPDGPLALGLVLMAGGVGAFIGAAFSARLTARFGYGPSLIGALIVGNTAPLLGMLAARDTTLASLAVLAAAFLASGLGVGVANSQAVTVRQLAVDEVIRGRVNAAYRLLSWGALPVGALAAGLTVELAGLWLAGVIGAAVMALSSLAVILSPVRRMRDLVDSRTA